MSKKLFARQLYSENGILRNQLISCDNNVITSLETVDENPGAENFDNISAGFFDIHINGGEKFYFTQKPDSETLEDIELSNYKYGTAYSLPTIITSSTENILKGIEATRHYMEQNPGSGIPGMHLEGPFLNPVKRGAHLEAFVRKPTDSELDEIIRYGKGVIRLMTIAPEMFTADQIQMLLDSGITISAGHSNATYSESQAAFDQGIQIVTHLYNAMSPFQHRQPGLVGATFDNSNVYAPLIVDGVHCDFGAASVAYKIKKDKLILISDALFLGQKVTEFKWGEFDARLKNGQYTNSEGNLAGATISLADGVSNAVKQLGIPPVEAIAMATVRPARALGLDSQLGKIEVGYPSTFTAFDDDLSLFEVIRL